LFFFSKEEEEEEEANAFDLRRDFSLLKRSPSFDEAMRRDFRAKEGAMMILSVPSFDLSEDWSI